MKRRQLSLMRILAVTTLAATPIFAVVPFDSATVTKVENSVTVGQTKNGKAVSKKSASVSDVIRASNYLQTASESRAELEFKDKSIVRVGQNSVFTFDAKSRTLSLEKGDMLFYVPPGGDGGTIKTPAITAAITGTLCKVTTELIAVLRGSIMTKYGRITAGEAIKVVNGHVEKFKFDPKAASKGKLYKMGPLPEDPGVQITENDTVLMAKIDRFDAQDRAQTNNNVNEERTAIGKARIAAQCAAARMAHTTETIVPVHIYPYPSPPAPRGVNGR